jgi:uncharacterized membrane protein
MVVAATPFVWASGVAARLPEALAPWLDAATGSQFPVFPFSAFVLAGTLAGALVGHAPPRRRHALETLQSNGRRIWNGQAQIRARKARPHEATIWSNLSGEVAVADPDEETDSITVWLIPTSTGRHLRDAP